MTYNKFYTAILSRFILVIFLSALITYLCFEKQAYSICIVLFIFLIERVINTIRYFNKTNQVISAFFLGIENEDTSLRVPQKTGSKVLDEVYLGIERLNNLFIETKNDIRGQEQYYLSIINQSATGLFSINQKERVININPSAQKLTNLQDQQHLNSLIAIDSALPDFIMNSNKNQQSAIFENQYGQKLLFKVSEMQTPREKIRLVAVSDITKELDNGEVDAWIKLARTLSHEIMNNIAPITTLSQVISNYFTRKGQIIEATSIDTSVIANTVKGLSVIEERSLGLMNFVENYRRFTKLPAPRTSEVDLSMLIEHNVLAIRTFANYNSIEFEKVLPESLMVYTDENLFSQVITNLLNNACEALIIGNVVDPRITIQLLEAGNLLRVDISNNGPIIPPEIREQIFIPFFTTKEEGSGVGLSLSKQIMLKMNGDILLKSTRDGLTTFSVIFYSDLN
jgi:nitrogen fixation/metabolism regulation signal transduction histidine kinase